VSREVTVKTIRDSQDALARDLGDPMSKVEIKTMFAWAFTRDAVLREVLARGVKDLEISEPSANEPRAAGAAEDSLGGWLRVDTKVPQNSQNEFAFVHIGLFVKAAKGDMARDVSAYFNKPAPRKVPGELVDYESQLEDVEATAADDKRNRGKPKPSAFPPMVLRYSEPDSEGRNSFTFDLGNSGATTEHVAFTLRWQLRSTPKEPKPAAQPAGGRKK